jgi:hypothetical protein
MRRPEQLGHIARPTPSSHAEHALAETFAKHPSFKGVRVRVRNGLATLIGVPVAALDVLGTLLHRTKWEARGAHGARPERGARDKSGASKKRGARRKKA